MTTKLVWKNDKLFLIKETEIKIENGVLNVSNMGLTELPELPENLQDLNCINNQLTELPELPENLQKLSCSSNQLTES